MANSRGIRAGRVNITNMVFIAWTEITEPWLNDIKRERFKDGNLFL